MNTPTPRAIRAALAGAVLAVLAAAPARADEVIWRDMLYPDVSDLAVAGTQLSFRLPNGTTLARPLAEVQLIRLASDPDLSRAEELARAGLFEPAAASYAAVQARDASSPRAALVRARADLNRLRQADAKRRQDAADNAEPAEPEPQPAPATQPAQALMAAPGLLSLDDCAALPATHPADPAAQDPLLGQVVLWTLTVTDLLPNSEDPDIQVRGASAGGSTATFSVPASAASGLKVGQKFEVAAVVSKIQRPARPGPSRVQVELSRPFFRAAETRSGPEQADVVILLDNSGSMISEYDAALESAVQAILDLPPQCRLAVVLTGRARQAPPAPTLLRADPIGKLLWLRHVLAGPAAGPDRGPQCLREALALLDANPVPDRLRRVDVYSDGTLTDPAGFTRIVEKRPAESAVPVNAFTFGSDADGLDLLAKLASITRGRCRPFGTP